MHTGRRAFKTSLNCLRLPAQPTTLIPTSLSYRLFSSSHGVLQTHVMLGKALQAKDTGPAPGPKGSTSSKHKGTLGKPLKPRPAAELNKARSFWPAMSNPLKRSASLINAKEPTLSRQSSGASSNTFAYFSPGSSDGGRVGKLHDAVYFDENDFEDDADIDLDADEPAILNPPSQIPYPTLPQTTQAVQHAQVQALYPTLPVPSRGVQPTTETPPSTENILWSSSPLQHKLPPPKRTASPTKSSKRRKLPWQDETDQRRQDSSEVPHDVRSIIDRNRALVPAAGLKAIDRDKARAAKSGHDKFSSGEHSRTPLSKDHDRSPFPWNKTASAMKEEQKRVRQGNKKLVKNLEADDTSRMIASMKKKQNLARVCLSEEQRKVLDLVAEENKSVFFTGSAGTGKSVLLREIIKTLRVKYKTQPDRVAVTASTGLAACNVGGVTLHSFSGIGLGKEDIPELVKKIKRNVKAKNRWMRTKILIIDEISMVDGDLFDKLEGVARIIRNNGRPFGGIQLVITGDFFQLPPVPDYGKVAKFSFDAATWNTSIEHTIGLTQVFRQKDPGFANMLNEMRLGKISPQSIEAFRSLNRPLAIRDDFDATELFPTRHEVDNANNNRMRNLDGKSWEYRADDGGSIQDHTARDKLLSNCMAPPLITLKKGAQVMLIKNIDETLVNGSVGKVVAFMDEKTFDIYHEDEEGFQAVETMDLQDEKMTQSRQKLKALINKDGPGDTSQKWPLVRFALADGSSRDLLVQKEPWTIELPNGEVQASRSQIPLILAWALSIHKAQGQTLERVKVDLGKIFEKGQAYVALSRATCQEGLQILRFDPKKVMAHDKVRSFYNSLYSIDEAQPGSTRVGAASKKVVVEEEHEKDFVRSLDEEDFMRSLGVDDDTDALQELYSR